MTKLRHEAPVRARAGDPQASPAPGLSAASPALKRLDYATARQALSPLAGVGSLGDPSARVAEVLLHTLGGWARARARVLASADPVAMRAWIAAALGEGVDASALVRLMVGGQLPLPARLEVVDDVLLGGARAAYAQEGGGVVLLARSILADRAASRLVFAEELGHHLDATLGAGDALGDEGERFAIALVEGRAPSAEERAASLADDDHGVVEVGGRRLQVEFSEVDPMDPRYADLCESEFKTAWTAGHRDIAEAAYRRLQAAWEGGNHSAQFALARCAEVMGAVWVDTRAPEEVAPSPDEGQRRAAEALLGELGASEAKTPETIVGALAEREDPWSRRALTTLLTAGQTLAEPEVEDRPGAAWATEDRLGGPERGLELPEMSPQTLVAARLTAARKLAARPGELAPDEWAGLAWAHGAAEARPDDRSEDEEALAETTGAALRQGLDGRHEGEVVAGAITAIAAGSAGYRALTEVLLDAGDGFQLNRQGPPLREALGAAAMAGEVGACWLLARLVARGIVASSVAEALLVEAAAGGHAALVVETLLEVLADHGDQHRLLATLGRAVPTAPDAALPAPLAARVRRLRGDLQAGLADPGTRPSSAAGLAALAPLMSVADLCAAVDALGAQPTETLAALLSAAIAEGAPEVALEAAETLCEIPWPRLPARLSRPIQAYAATAPRDLARRLGRIAWGLRVPEPVEAIVARWGVPEAHLAETSWMAYVTLGEAEVRRLDLAMGLHNGLHLDLREALGLPLEPVEPAMVGALLRMGLLRGTELAFLLDADIEGRVLLMQGNLAFDLAELDHQIDESRVILAQRNSDLAAHAVQDKLGLGSHLAEATVGSDAHAAFRQRQEELVDRLEGRARTLARQLSLRRMMASYHMALELALAGHAYRGALSRGDLERADAVAMEAYGTHGSLLSEASPELWLAVTGTGDAVPEQGAAARTARQSGDESAGPRAYEVGGEDGLRQALETLAGEEALSPQALSAALQAVDMDPALVWVAGRAGAMGDELPRLAELLQAGLKGSTFDDYIEHVRESASALHQALSGEEAAPLVTAAHERVEALRRAARATGDATARAALTGRADAIATFLAAASADGELARLTRSLLDESMLRSDSLGSWIARDGVQLVSSIGCAVLAALGVVAVIKTGGLAALGLIALGGAAGGLAGHELAREGLHFVHHRRQDIREGRRFYSDRSEVGAYLAGEDVFDPETGRWRKRQLGLDVVAAYGGRLARDWATSWAIMGLGQQAGRFLSECLAGTAPQRVLARCATRLRQLHRRMRAIQGQADPRFMRRFAREFGEELAEEGSEEALEQLLVKVNPKLGVLAALVVASRSGLRVVPRGGRVSCDPADVGRLAEVLRTQGCEVRTRADGGLQVMTCDGADFEVDLAPAEGDTPGRAAQGAQGAANELPPPLTPDERVAADAKADLLMHYFRHVVASGNAPELAHLADLEVRVRFESEPGELQRHRGDSDHMVAALFDGTTVILHQELWRVPSELLLPTLAHELQHAYDDSLSGHVTREHRDSEVRAADAELAGHQAAERHAEAHGLDREEAMDLRAHDPLALEGPAGTLSGHIYRFLQEVGGGRSTRAWVEENYPDILDLRTLAPKLERHREVAQLLRQGLDPQGRPPSAAAGHYATLYEVHGVEGIEGHGARLLEIEARCRRGLAIIELETRRALTDEPLAEDARGPAPKILQGEVRFAQVAAVAGGDMTGEGLDADPARTLAWAAEQAEQAEGVARVELTGRGVRLVHLRRRGRSHLRVRLSTRRPGEGEERAPVADYHYYKESDQAVIQLSDTASELNVRRALVHALAAVGQLSTRRAYEGLGLSPAQRGRVAELDLLLAGGPVGALSPAEVAREVEAIVHELALWDPEVGNLPLVLALLSPEAAAALEAHLADPTGAGLLTGHLDADQAHAEAQAERDALLDADRRPMVDATDLQAETLEELAEAAQLERRDQSEATLALLRELGDDAWVYEPQIGGGAALAGLRDDQLLVDARGRWPIDASHSLAQTARQLLGVDDAGMASTWQYGPLGERVPRPALTYWQDMRASQGLVVDGRAELKLEDGELVMVVTPADGHKDMRPVTLKVRGTPAVATGFPPETVPGARADRAKAYEAWDEAVGAGAAFTGDQLNEAAIVDAIAEDPHGPRVFLLAGPGGTNISAAENILDRMEDATVIMVGGRPPDGLEQNVQWLSLCERFGPNGTERPDVLQIHTNYRLHEPVYQDGDQWGFVAERDGTETSFAGDALVASLGRPDPTRVPGPLAALVEQLGEDASGELLFDERGRYVGYRVTLGAGPDAPRVDVTGAASRFPPGQLFGEDEVAEQARAADMDAPYESGNFDGGYTATAEQTDRYRRFRAAERDAAGEAPLPAVGPLPTDAHHAHGPAGSRPARPPGPLSPAQRAAADAKAQVLTIYARTVIERGHAPGLAHIAKLREVTVRFEAHPEEIARSEPAGGTSRACYFPSDNTVVLRQGMWLIPSEYLLPAVVHELQHAYDESLAGAQAPPSQAAERRSTTAEAEMVGATRAHAASRGTTPARAAAARGHDGSAIAADAWAAHLFEQVRTFEDVVGSGQVGPAEWVAHHYAHLPEDLGAYEPQIRDDLMDARGLLFGLSPEGHPLPELEGYYLAFVARFPSIAASELTLREQLETVVGRCERLLLAVELDKRSRLEGEAHPDADNAPRTGPHDLGQVAHGFWSAGPEGVRRRPGEVARALEFLGGRAAFDPSRYQDTVDAPLADYLKAFPSALRPLAEQTLAANQATPLVEERVLRLALLEASRDNLAHLSRFWRVTSDQPASALPGVAGLGEVDPKSPLEARLYFQETFLPAVAPRTVGSRTRRDPSWDMRAWLQGYRRPAVLEEMRAAGLSDAQAERLVTLLSADERRWLLAREWGGFPVTYLTLADRTDTQLEVFKEAYADPTLRDATFNQAPVDLQAYRGRALRMHGSQLPPEQVRQWGGLREREAGLGPDPVACDLRAHAAEEPDTSTWRGSNTYVPAVFDGDKYYNWGDIIYEVDAAGVHIDDAAAGYNASARRRTGQPPVRWNFEREDETAIWHHVPIERVRRIGTRTGATIEWEDNPYYQNRALWEAHYGGD